MDLNGSVYFDYAATTPVEPRVVTAMQPYFSRRFANPSSVHRGGQVAEHAVEAARARMADVLNCTPDELYFTSCGSESDNLALRGVAFAAREARGANHLLISPVEHHAISHTARQLASHFDFDLEVLPVDDRGRVHPAAVAERLRPDTALVSVIYANNEIGTINPIAEIGRACRDRGILFHTDAVQAGAYLDLDVQALHVDLLSLGAHKFYGPKGIGALYVRPGTSILPQQTGGGQEGGLRAGTTNVPYVVGMAEALDIAQADREEEGSRLRALRDHLIDAVLERISDSRLTGHPGERLPNHASFVFNALDGNALLMALDMAGFACSSGSACKTGSPEPSDVLIAIGLSPEWALGSLRVTLGRGSTPAQIERFLEILPGAVERLRRIGERTAG